VGSHPARPRRTGLRGLGILGLAAFLLLPGGCGTAGVERHAARTEPSATVLRVISHGWHTGLALRRDDLPAGRLPWGEAFPGAEYLEVGWGHREFYQAPEPSLGLALRAALWPGGSVLHVAALDGADLAGLPPGVVAEIPLSRAGLERLVRFLEDAHARDETGRAVVVGPGLTARSRFYLGRERYHLLSTCNTWTARALREAGCLVGRPYPVTAEGLMARARDCAG
jgi:uncharacterized protein (TIGR02117 family)